MSSPENEPLQKNNAVTDHDQVDELRPTPPIDDNADLSTRVKQALKVPASAKPNSDDDDESEKISVEEAYREINLPDVKEFGSKLTADDIKKRLSPDRIKDILGDFADKPAVIDDESMAMSGGGGGGAEDQLITRLRFLRFKYDEVNDALLTLDVPARFMKAKKMKYEDKKADLVEKKTQLVRSIIALSIHGAKRKVPELVGLDISENTDAEVVIAEISSRIGPEPEEQLSNTYVTPARGSQ